MIDIPEREPDTTLSPRYLGGQIGRIVISGVLCITLAVAPALSLAHSGEDVLDEHVHSSSGNASM